MKTIYIIIAIILLIGGFAWLSPLGMENADLSKETLYISFLGMFLSWGFAGFFFCKAL